MAAGAPTCPNSPSSTKFSGGSLGYTLDHVSDSKRCNMDVATLGLSAADSTNVNVMTYVILAQPGVTNNEELLGLGAQFHRPCSIAHSWLGCVGTTAGIALHSWLQMGLGERSRTH
jgi:hypothetical protein